MYWQALMIDRRIDHEHLRAAFADVFNLNPSRVEIIDYPALWTGPIPPEPRIVLERIRRDGSFPLHLNVSLAGDVVERPVATLAGTIARACDLARLLGAVLLLATGPIGNEEEIRVAPDGTVDIVQLDGDALDEDRYVIVGARPFADLPAEAAQTPA